MSTITVSTYLEETIRAELNDNSEGILRSQRGSFFGGFHLDNNLFFTLSAYFLLKNSFVDVKLDLENCIHSNLHFYANKYGRNTYNFWKTNPDEQFPNSRLVSRIKHFWIPDDLDCTALSYFFRTRDDLDLFRESIHRFIVHSERCVGGVTIPKGYYSTWFGENMPDELDVCVLSNYLVLLDDSKVELLPADHRCREVLTQVLKTDIWLSDPFEISPNYQTIPIIAFHLSRFLASYGSTLEKELNDRFMLKLKELLSQSSDDQDRIMLGLSLLLLGDHSFNAAELTSETIERFINEFSFFKAPMLASSRNAYLRSKAKKKRWNLPFVCKGFNASILLKIMSDL